MIFSKDNLFLIISDFGVEDLGIYICMVSNNVGLDLKFLIINILCKLFRFYYCDIDYIFIVKVFLFFFVGDLMMEIEF